MDIQTAARKLVEREVLCCASSLIYELLSHFEAAQQLDVDYDDLMNLGSSTDYDGARDEAIADDEKLYEILGSEFDFEELAKELGVRPTDDELARFAASNESFDTVDEDDEDPQSGWFYFMDRADCFESVHQLITHNKDAEKEALSQWANDSSALEYLNEEQKQVLRDTLINDFDAKALCSDYDINTDDYHLDVYEHWIVSDWLRGKLESHGECVGEVFGLDIWGRCTTGSAIYMDGIIESVVKATGYYGYGSEDPIPEFLSLDRVGHQGMAKYRVTCDGKEIRNVIQADANTVTYFNGNPEGPITTTLVGAVVIERIES